MSVDKKVVLVTGAASGIGESIAKHFLQLGYFVHISDQDPESLAQFLENHPKNDYLVDYFDDFKDDLMKKNLNFFLKSVVNNNYGSS